MYLGLSLCFEPLLNVAAGKRTNASRNWQSCVWMVGEDIGSSRGRDVVTWLPVTGLVRKLDYPLILTTLTFIIELTTTAHERRNH
eukprot:4955372-Amphidinium_carterae.1